MATINFDDREMEAKLTDRFVNGRDYPDRRLTLSFTNERGQELKVRLSFQEVAHILCDLKFSRLTGDLFEEASRQLEMIGRDGYGP